MEVKATLRHLHIAPRKVRLVAGLVRGLPLQDALVQLRHLPKRSSLPLEKLLKSAAANARHNFNLDEKNLRIKAILVDSGPVQKRIEPRAFGRGFVVRKRMSHILVTLDELQPSLQKSRWQKKAAGPEIRQISPNLRDEIEIEDQKEGKPLAREPQHVKAKDHGVVRRMFQRKSV